MVARRHRPTAIARRDELGGHPGRDHQVERHEQVRRLTADLDRHPQGQHGEGGDRERPGVAPKARGERRQRRDQERDREGDPRRAVAEVGHPWLVPDVAEDEDGRDRERRDHRREPPGAPLEQQGRRGRTERGDHADQLERRGGHGEPGSPSAPSTDSGSTVIRRGQIISRSSLGSPTRRR